MGAYIHFTDEQKQKANSVNLVDFLEKQGEKLLRSGREKRLASDRSITVRGNRWYLGNGTDGRITGSVLVCPVFQVSVDHYGTVRDIRSIKRGKIAQSRTPPNRCAEA